METMNIDDIRKHRALLRQIALRHGITNIYVFGSVARGESTPASDVDFLLDMNRDASLFGVGGFIHDSSKLLGIKVDAVPRCVLAQVDDQAFAHRIQEEAVPL